MSPPHVVAVVVTGKSAEHVRRFLPICLESLLLQDYPNLTILLATEARNRELLKPFAGGQVCGVSPKAENPTLGDLRNAALDWCAKERPGAYVIQCDDDDYHGPNRIRVQIDAAMQEGCPSLLKRQLCYSWDTNVAFIRELKLFTKENPDGRPTPIHGTICHPPTDLRYPSLAQGEDTPFFRAFERFVEVDGPAELYVRFSHRASTSSHAHVMQAAADYRPGTWAIPQAMIPFLEGVLAKYPGAEETGVDTPLREKSPPAESYATW